MVLIVPALGRNARPCPSAAISPQDRPARTRGRPFITPQSEGAHATVTMTDLSRAAGQHLVQEESSTVYPQPTVRWMSPLAGTIVEWPGSTQCAGSTTSTATPSLPRWTC